MSEEVGKISLGMEITGADLNKQISSVAGMIGTQITKQLQSTFKGFSLDGLAGNISKTLKTSTETALKGLVSGMEESVSAIEGRLLKTVSVAKDAMKQSIEDNRVAAESAIDSVGAKLSKLKMPLIFPSKMMPDTSVAGAAAVTPTGVPKAVTSPKVKPDIDTEAVKAQISGLSDVIDNVNAKIEIQQRKLADLKEAYANTFNESAKSKLQEKIVNTEGALLRLTQSSDKAMQKIWVLEDSLKNAGQAAQQVEQPVQKLGSKLIQTNKPLKSVKGNLNSAAKAATKAGTSFTGAGKKAGGMGNSFTKAFSRILKQVFVFAVLYKAIRGFNSYLSGSLSTNAQYAASLNAIKTNLAVAFQPIYESILPALQALMSFLAKATAYIAAFISAIFGKTYQQSYAAAKGIETAKKAMEGYGKKAKKAGKEAKGALAGFDELNTLDISGPDTADEASGGGDKGFEMAMPDMDITGIQGKMDSLVAGIKSTFDTAWSGIKSGWSVLVATFGPAFSTAWGSIAPVLTRWKEQFKLMFNDIISLGAPLANWFTNNLVPLWQKGIETAGHVWSGLLDIVLSIVSSIWDAVFPILNKLITEGLPRLTDFLTGVHDIFRKIFDIAKQIFDDIWRVAIDPAMQLISKIIQDTLDIIFRWWDEWGTKIVAGLKEALDNIKKLWTNLFDNVLEPIITKALDMFTWLWDKHLKGLITEIGNFIGKLYTAALDILNKFVLPIVNWLVKTLGPAFSNTFSFVVDVVGTAVGAIADVVKGIIKALGGVIDFIAGVFTGDWRKAWEGIKTIVSGIADSIVGVFRGAVNLIIDAFNFMISGMNKINVKVPDWVPGDLGGKEFGFSVGKIPKLAKGGLAYGPTLAMVGDNKGASADPEVISPLSKLQDMLGGNNQPMIEILSLILDAIKNGDKQTTLSVNGTEIGRVVTDAINDITRRTGKSPLIT